MQTHGDDSLGELIWLRSIRSTRENQAAIVTGPCTPDLAGIDPHPLLDWGEGEEDDNIGAVNGEI